MTMHIAADTKLSVNKAAALWGISATTIYKALDNGQLARAGDGKLVAAEMTRVFGKLKVAGAAQDDAPTTAAKPLRAKKASPAATPAPRRKKAVSPDAAAPAPDTPAPLAPPLEHDLRQQIALLEQQLVEAKAREDWLKAQINELWTEKVELQNAKKGVLGRLLG